MATHAERMSEAINRLQALGVPFYRPSEHQLKIGKLNYYPGKGTINFDGHPALAERGLEACVRIVLNGQT